MDLFDAFSAAPEVQTSSEAKFTTVVTKKKRKATTSAIDSFGLPSSDEDMDKDTDASSLKKRKKKTITKKTIAQEVAEIRKKNNGKNGNIIPKKRIDGIPKGLNEKMSNDKWKNMNQIQNATGESQTQTDTDKKDDKSTTTDLDIFTPSLSADVEWESFEITEDNKNCVHQVVRPKGSNFKPWGRVTTVTKSTTKESDASETVDDSNVIETTTIPNPDLPNHPAKKFPYKLDTFQARAVQCLERGESVLVAAHTSAGKTTVAEYGIAKAIQEGKKVIYTSPIKALSNQKYRDLCDEFSRLVEEGKKKESNIGDGDEENMNTNEGPDSENNDGPESSITENPDSTNNPNLDDCSVGLMTGDVTIRPHAPIIIMTTEILRSMLYRGSELCKETSLVIYDECHYLGDASRGVIWEESIVLLPDSVRCIFLSATIPNAAEFAEWICRVKHQCCHILYTDWRPVPLQHYMFPSGSEQVHLVLDEKGVFREDAFINAVNSLSQKENFSQSGMQIKAIENGNKKNNMKQDKGAAGDLEKLLSMCAAKNHLPCIVFSFSRKQCEYFANSLKNGSSATSAQMHRKKNDRKSSQSGLSKLDLASADEKVLISEVFSNAIQTLASEDQELPQIDQLLQLCLRGIGIHHGGLLPVLKEIVEILFCEGLIKVLFATETFAIGVNMPAKCVIFTSIKKWDGKENRVLSTSEYLQMAGRAGRRGKDKKGLSIMMLDSDNFNDSSGSGSGGSGSSKKLDPETAKTLLASGNTTKLESAFHLSYNMLLSLLRMEGGSPNYMIERSFRQFQRDRQLLALKEEIESLRRRLTDEFQDVCWSLSEEGRKRLMEEIEKMREVEKNCTNWKKNKKNSKDSDSNLANSNKESDESEVQPTSKSDIATLLSQLPDNQSLTRTSDLSMTINTLLADYFLTKRAIKRQKMDLKNIMLRPDLISPFLNPGRMVYIETKNSDVSSETSNENGDASTVTSSSSTTSYGWGLVVNFQKKIVGKGKGKGKGQSQTVTITDPSELTSAKNNSQGKGSSSDSTTITGTNTVQESVNETVANLEAVSSTTSQEDADFWNGWSLNVFVQNKGLQSCTTSVASRITDSTDSNNGAILDHASEQHEQDLDQSNPQVLPFSIFDVQRISSIRANVDLKSRDEIDNKKLQISAALKAIVTHKDMKSNGGVPELKPDQDLKHSPQTVDRIEAIKKSISKLEKKKLKSLENRLNSIPESVRNEMMLKFGEKIRLQERLEDLEARIQGVNMSSSMELNDQDVDMKDSHSAIAIGTPDSDTTAGVIGSNSDATDSKAIVPVTNKNPTPVPTVDKSLQSLSDDLVCMRRLLRRLGFLNEHDVVQLKGSLACELSTCDEVLLTELVFRNIFADLSPEYLVALLSCLVFDEKKSPSGGGGKGTKGKGKGKSAGGGGDSQRSGGGLKNTNPAQDENHISKHPDLVQAFEHLKTVASEVGLAMNESKLPVDAEQYTEKLNPGLMDLVVDWMNGISFVEIMETSELFEGTIIRVMRRLEELVRELGSAAGSIGNTELEAKCTIGRARLKRGIVFAASLYL